MQPDESSALTTVIVVGIKRIPTEPQATDGTA